MQYPINNKAIYRTWILVVLWVLQMIVEIVVIGVNGLRVSVLAAVLSVVNNSNNGSYSISTGDSSNNYCYTDAYGNLVCSTGGYSINSSYIGILLAGSVVALTLGIIFFITHIVQVVQYARRRLSPKANFGYDCFRFVATTITFILNIAAGVTGGFYILGLIFIVLNWILYLCSLIYSSILFHRYRRGDYNNLLPTTQEPTQYQSQIVYPNKQEANYNAGQYQQPYQSNPGVVPTPPSFRH